MVRITNLVDRPREIEIIVDGEPVRAFAGESVGAALLAAGIYQLRSSPRRGGPRGMLCLMGVCQECVVRIDGRIRQACLETARDGMAVTLGIAAV